VAHLMANGDSAIKVPAGSELERAIASASSIVEIQNLLHEAAAAQGLIQRDPLDRDGTDWFSHHVVQQPVPQGFAKTIVVNGQKVILQSETEDGLVAEELKVMRAVYGKTDAVTTEQQRDSQGRFVAQSTQEQIEAEAARVAAAANDPAAAAEAEIVRKALEAQGIDPAALREFSAAREGERIQTSWAQAVEAFRENHPEWKGGSVNQALFARLLDENNLADAADKVAALEAVYNHAVENNLLVENPELTALDAIGKAQTYEELKSAVCYKDPTTGSGIWGR
jgi:hypothetical protein